MPPASGSWRRTADDRLHLLVVEGSPGTDLEPLAVPDDGVARGLDDELDESRRREPVEPLDRLVTELYSMAIFTRCQAESADS